MQALAERARAPSVSDKAQATELLGRAHDAMASLGEVLERETGHLAAGRIGAGLAEEAAKGERAAAYFLALQACKANVVALARLVPERLGEFKAAQLGFMEIVARNQSVIETARAVADGLVKGLAAEVERSRQVGGYGRPHVPVPARPSSATSPLVFSGRF